MKGQANSGDPPATESEADLPPLSEQASSSSSSSNSFKNETSQTETLSPKLNQFFDSYVSEVNLQDGAESVCSESISRYDENIGQGDHQSFPHAGMHSSKTPGRQGSFRHQVLGDTTSLATLVAERRHSDSRRTFCLFVTFDLILTALLWLIMCGTSSGGGVGFLDIVIEQVTKYSQSTSMFDVVCLAFGRFAFLQLCYALLWIKHWWPVAVSTSVSDILLILKIFPIFNNTAQATYLEKAIPMTIVILLTNFILTWIEVWFIDFKVLPEEARLIQRTVRRFTNANGSAHGYVPDDMDESTPLIRSHTRRYIPPTATSFYTVPASDRMSYHTVLESEFESRLNLRHNICPAISPEDAVHVEKAKDALNKLWAMYNDMELWKLEKKLENGDCLYTTNVPQYGKTFRFDATIHGATCQQIYQEIIMKTEVMPTWNSSVSDVKILKLIGDQTAVSLEVSAPAAKGLIQSRDFVTARRVEKINNCYISAGISTDYPIPESGRIRGINGPTGFIVVPIEGEFASTKFTWILNTNLKGSLPQYLVNSNLAATMITFVESMKCHLGIDE